MKVSIDFCTKQLVPLYVSEIYVKHWQKGPSFLWPQHCCKNVYFQKTMIWATHTVVLNVMKINLLAARTFHQLHTFISCTFECIDSAFYISIYVMCCMVWDDEDDTFF
jgi:hypothetical protein